MFSLLIISIFFTVCSTQFHYLSINENDIAPRHLLTFNSPDRNTSFKLISPKLHKYFSIKNQTQLFVVESLDREYLCKKNYCSCSIPCSIELKILSEPFYKISYINVTINDINDNLHYFPVNEIQLNIPENTNVSHRQCYRIPSVYDEDLPETNQFIYRLMGDDHQRFHIDQNLCLKIKNNSLDREQTSRYDNLWIIAQDQLKQQAKIQIHIQVLDTNDNSPKFSTNSTIFHINETFTGELTCLTASDPDEGKNGHVIYSFNHLEKIVFNYFSINNQTGCIKILHPLFNLTNHLLITIRAQDSASSLSSSLPVYHLLQLYIHHKPIIEVRQMIFGMEILKNNSFLNITENTIGLLALITIEDFNQRIFGEIFLNLIIKSEYDIHQQAFLLKSISNKFYKLELILPLDYEIESSFSLYLDAIQPNEEFTRFIIHIRIDNINDIPPKFDQDFYNFHPNIQSTLLIGQVHANDIDTLNTSLVYSLDSDLFYINSQTGEIYLMKPPSIDLIDRRFTFHVNVTDGKYISQTNVTVIAQGFNHQPEFDKNEYYFQINENIPIRTIIGKIHANDKDLSTTRRGKLTFSLRSITSNSQFFFHISHIGEIIVMRIPDAEQQQIHQFMVIVKDHGIPSLSNEAKLTIKINDINEYCPKLVNKSSEPYIFISNEYLSKIFTYRLSAFDKDLSDQSNIKFSLVSSSYSHLFQLNSNGLLILKQRPLNLPSIVQLRINLSDEFYRQPCIVQQTLIIVIGETLKHERPTRHLIKQKKLQDSEIIFIFLFITLCITILISILILLFILCSQNQKRRRSITTKSTCLVNPTLLIDDFKQPSPPPSTHIFTTDIQ